MRYEEIVRLIISFLGGGLVVGILDWIRLSFSERTARKAEYLMSQIRQLYGPLYFFTSQNKSLFDLNKKLLEAHKIEYSNKNWSQDKTTQESISKESNQTIDIANKYGNMAKENNEKIIEILKNNYEFIDYDDIDLFQEFIIDYLRVKFEMNKAGQIQIPYRIFKHLGEIIIVRADFINIVKEKFQAKNKELKSYQLNWFKRWICAKFK